MLIERDGTLATPGIGYVLNSTGSTRIAGTRKWMTWPTTTSPSANTNVALENLRLVNREYIHEAPYWSVPALFSAHSITAYLSGHWLANEVALEHAAQNELFKPQTTSVARQRMPQIWLEWFSPRNNRQFYAQIAATGSTVKPLTLEDRGRMENGTGDQRLKLGDALTLRPVMRTLAGNGLRLALSVRSPGGEFHQSFTGHPSPRGGDSWIFGDHTIPLKLSGGYTVHITGTTLWPAQTFNVRYQFVVQSD